MYGYRFMYVTCTYVAYVHLSIYRMSLMCVSGQCFQPPERIGQALDRHPREISKCFHIQLVCTCQCVYVSWGFHQDGTSQKPSIRLGWSLTWDVSEVSGILPNHPNSVDFIETTIGTWTPF